MLQIEVSPVAPRTGRRWTFASGGVSALEKVCPPGLLVPPGADRRRANDLRSVTSTPVNRLRRAVLLGRLSVDVPVGGVCTLSEIAINPPSVTPPEHPTWRRVLSAPARWSAKPGAAECASVQCHGEHRQRHQVQQQHGGG
jgi:hypothetical protein